MKISQLRPVYPLLHLHPFGRQLPLLLQSFGQVLGSAKCNSNSSLSAKAAFSGVPSTITSSMSRRHDRK
jgi:hypothetical protein